MLTVDQGTAIAARRFGSGWSSRRGWEQARVARIREEAALAELRALEQEFTKINDQVKIEIANATALKSQVAALVKAHPDSDHMKSSGAKWKSGEFKGMNKTIVRSLFEITLCQILEEKKIKTEKLLSKYSII